MTKKLCKATTNTGNPCKLVALIDGLCTKHYAMARKKNLESNTKINTTLICRECGATNDCSNLKDTIKRRILNKFDLELDSILEEL